MKKSAVAIIALLLVVSLTGCEKSFWPRGTDITEFDIVRVIGFDKGDDDSVEVTVIAGRAQEAPGEGFGAVSQIVASGTGKTALEAVSNLRSKLDKKQTFGNVDYILFGEGVLDDLKKYVDYPARNTEFRYSPKVFAVRGGSAKDFINEGSSESVILGDSLDNFRININSRSDIKGVRLIDLMNMLYSDSVVILPALETVEQEGEKITEGELPEKRINAAGYAVVYDPDFLEYLDTDVARGYNYLTNETRSCTYSISDGAGGYVGFDVKSAGLRIQPHFNGNQLIGATYSVTVNASVIERSIHLSETTLRHVTEQLEYAIKNETLSAIAKSKEFGVDCLGLYDKIKIRHPYKWRKNEGLIYENLDIDAKVHVRI